MKTMNNITRIYEQEKPEGITKYSFEVDNPPNERDAYDALERFQVDVRRYIRKDTLSGTSNVP